MVVGSNVCFTHVCFEYNMVNDMKTILKKNAIKLAVTLNRLLHIAVIGYILLGAFLSWGSPLRWYPLFTILVMVQWKLNQGTCLLTNLENFLLKKKKAKSEQQGESVKKIISLCFNPLPTDDKIRRGLYGLLFFFIAIALMRLYIF